MSGNFFFVNLSDADWSGVEVWINQKYVLLVPSMPRNIAERLDFTMFFDHDGHHFDTQGGKNPLQSLEIYRDGKMFTVPATLD